MNLENGLFGWLIRQKEKKVRREEFLIATLCYIPPSPARPRAIRGPQINGICGYDPTRNNAYILQNRNGENGEQRHGVEHEEIHRVYGGILSHVDKIKSQKRELCSSPDIFLYVIHIMSLYSLSSLYLALLIFQKSGEKK